MFQLVYVSSGVKPFSSDELLQLLVTSRQNNEKLGISGMLLYKGGDFMQALEGDEAAVRSMSARIATDPRHGEITTVLQGPCEAREFPDWSMGFQDLSTVDPRLVPGYTTFLDSPLRASTFAANPATCRRLLLLFKNNPGGN